jgi:hypothetical protein
MPRVEFEPTIPEFDRAKIVHALDRTGTVIGHEGTWENGNTAPPFLTLALNGCETRFTLRLCFTHSLRGSTDYIEKGKIPCLYRESKPGRPARTLVTIPTELSGQPTYS